MTKTIIQTLIEFWQLWCHDHFPGKPLPETNYPFSEELFLNVQSEPSLTQLGFISLCPDACHQRAEISSSPVTASLEKVTEHRIRIK